MGAIEIFHITPISFDLYYSTHKLDTIPLSIPFTVDGYTRYIVPAVRSATVTKAPLLAETNGIEPPHDLPSN